MPCFAPLYKPKTSMTTLLVAHSMLYSRKNPTTVFAQVASHALRTAGIEHRFFHLDTTSFSFHGEYKTSNEPNEDQPKVISLCHGVFKDNHPELQTSGGVVDLLG